MEKYLTQKWKAAQELDLDTMHFNILHYILIKTLYIFFWSNGLNFISNLPFKKFGVSKIKKNKQTFIQQACFKLINSDSKDIYNVTKHFCFKRMLFFWTFYSSRTKILTTELNW